MEVEDKKAETDKALRESFGAAGIGRLYWNKEIKLANFGKVGVQLSEGFANGDIISAAKAGVGVFLLGKGKEAAAIQQLVCRGMLLNKLPTRLVSLPYLERMAKEGGDDWLSLQRAKVVGVQGFYDPQFEKAIPDDRRYSLDFELRGAVEGGKALVIQSPVPIDQCGWWSVILRELIADNTVLFSV